MSRPRIGLSSCRMGPDPERTVFAPKTLWYVERSMIDWVARSGALVYPVPPAPDPAPAADGDGDPDDDDGAVWPHAQDWVDDLDGLVLHGGSDVSPTSYGQQPRRPAWAGDAERDRYEIDLVHRFLDVGKPVLGVCRGIQVLNVALGGTLWQDLVDDGATASTHRDATAYDRLDHDLEVQADSVLARLVGAGRHRVNSIHHQGLRDLAPGLVAEARSAGDGIVEAVRLDGGASWCMGVQWHPEFVGPADTHLLDDTPIRSAFVQAAREVACRS